MKKLLCVLLILTMSLTLSLVAYADDIGIASDGGSANTDVYYTVSGSYYVTIPATISATNGSNTITFDVKCTENHTGNSFKIKVSSDNSSGNYWYFKNYQNNSSIMYTMSSQCSINGTTINEPVYSGGTFTLPAIGIASLTLSLESGDLAKALNGTYSDTLNFTVSQNVN